MLIALANIYSTQTKNYLQENAPKLCGTQEMQIYQRVKKDRLTRLDWLQNSINM